MCSGRVDLEFILRAFSNGQDGVFIGGCRLDECNYITHGNYDALATVYLCRNIMERIGINPERLRIEFMSGADGGLLAQATNDFTKKVNQLGPLGRGEGIDDNELTMRLETARKLVPYEAYHNFFTGVEFDRLFDELIGDKLAISQIMSLLQKGSRSTGEIAEGLGLNPSEISKYIHSSSRQGFVRYDESSKRYALA